MLNEKRIFGIGSTTFSLRSKRASEREREKVSDYERTKI
jgi:hypothetical protein